ncbi:hypothetical protein F7725_018184 [Dissostichus mawsoni]|uniref:Uncharacterized protein n=1 Tax=Dissostichus mawsoni TaxID=36200 RepID=A0A7J5XSD1_DISMA|nr:hypothetical protein F7725_018184 [Dissostichus mawsoni]
MLRSDQQGSSGSKRNQLQADNEKRLEDYENISTAHSAVSPNPLNDDTDTSEDELEINYSQVNLKAKTQRAARDLINSDEEETQYSHIKI